MALDYKGCLVPRYFKKKLRSESKNGTEWAASVLLRKQRYILHRVGPTQRGVALSLNCVSDYGGHLRKGGVHSDKRRTHSNKEKAYSWFFCEVGGDS